MNIFSQIRLRELLSYKLNVYFIFKKIKIFPLNLLIPLSNWGTDHVTAIFDLEQKKNSPASKAIGFAQVLNLFLAPILSGKSLLFEVTYFRSDSIWSDPFLKLKISKKLILPSYDTRWFLFKVINFEATHYQDSAKGSGKKTRVQNFRAGSPGSLPSPAHYPKWPIS